MEVFVGMCGVCNINYSQQDDGRMIKNGRVQDIFGRRNDESHLA